MVDLTVCAMATQRATPAKAATAGRACHVESELQQPALPVALILVDYKTPQPSVTCSAAVGGCRRSLCEFVLALGAESYCLSSLECAQVLVQS